MIQYPDCTWALYVVGYNEVNSSISCWWFAGSLQIRPWVHACLLARLPHHLDLGVLFVCRHVIVAEGGERESFFMSLQKKE